MTREQWVFICYAVLVGLLVGFTLGFVIGINSGPL